MTQQILSNGLVKLTNEQGVIDTRNGRWYTQAIVKARDVQYFAPSTEDKVADADYVSDSDAMAEINTLLQ